VIGMLDIVDGNRVSVLSVFVSYAPFPNTYDEPDADKGQHFYSREIVSQAEKEAIACLVKDDHLTNIYIFTWFGFTYKEKEVRI